MGQAGVVGAAVRQPLGSGVVAQTRKSPLIIERLHVFFVRRDSLAQALGGIVQTMQDFRG
jgi:hypothetical protein